MTVPKKSASWVSPKWVKINAWRGRRKKYVLIIAPHKQPGPKSSPFMPIQVELPAEINLIQPYPTHTYLPGTVIPLHILSYQVCVCGMQYAILQGLGLVQAAETKFWP